MSEENRLREEWRDAFLTLSAFSFGLASIGEWWFGLLCLPLSLIGAALASPPDTKTDP